MQYLLTLVLVAVIARTAAHTSEFKTAVEQLKQLDVITAALNRAKERLGK